ncbi:MAG: nuclear transport factor 2 family protein [Gemmatimonadota bacterium]
MDVEQVAQRFVDAINGGDVESLSALMTDDHVFVDSDGSRTVGRQAVRDAWSQFFAMVGDYTVTVEERFHSGDTAVLVGMATGTVARAGGPRRANAWTVPAAWRVVVRADRVAVWQVFVNPEPILAALQE